MAAVPEFEQKRVVSLFVVLAYLGLALLGIWLVFALRPLIIPLVVATIIAMILIPEVDRWEKRGYKRGAAIGLIYFLFLAICAVTLVLLIPLITHQMQLISHYLPTEMLRGKPADAQTLAERWLDDHPYVPTMLHDPIVNQARHVPELTSKGIAWFTANLPALAGSLIWVVLVPVIAFFLLLDFHKILGKLLILAPISRRQDILTIMTDIVAVFGNYVRGVFLVMLLDIAVIFGVLLVPYIGLRGYALTLAVTAGVLYTIPYFGAIVSTLLIGLATLAVHHGQPVPALVVTGLMILIHQVIFDNIVAPRVIGGSVHLHPLLTLLALLAGGTLLGIGGTLLAVPIAAAAQVILLRVFPQFHVDVGTAQRAETVTKAAIDKKDEQEKPPLRKEGDEAELAGLEEEARQSAQPVLPETPTPPVLTAPVLTPPPPSPAKIAP